MASAKQGAGQGIEGGRVVRWVLLTPYSSVVYGSSYLLSPPALKPPEAPCSTTESHQLAGSTKLPLARERT